MGNPNPNLFPISTRPEHVNALLKGIIVHNANDNRKLDDMGDIDGTIVQ